MHSRFEQPIVKKDAYCCFQQRYFIIQHLQKSFYSSSMMTGQLDWV